MAVTGAPDRLHSGMGGSSRQALKVIQSGPFAITRTMGTNAIPVPELDQRTRRDRCRRRVQGLGLWFPKRNPVDEETGRNTSFRSTSNTRPREPGDARIASWIPRHQLPGPVAKSCQQSAASRRIGHDQKADLDRFRQRFADEAPFSQFKTVSHIRDTFIETEKPRKIKARVLFRTQFVGPCSGTRTGAKRSRAEGFITTRAQPDPATNHRTALRLMAIIIATVPLFLCRSSMYQQRSDQSEKQMD